MSEIKLKPCPFCGGGAKIKHGYPGQQQKGMRQAVVQCKKCGCRTVTYRQYAYQSYKEVDEQAIEAWNRRAAMSDDLISREEVLKFLYEIKDDSCIPKNYGTILDIIKHVRNMPRTFDQEKVAANLREELKLSEIEKERCITESPSQFQSAKGYANGVAFAIEIVKKGGIE